MGLVGGSKRRTRTIAGPSRSAGYAQNGKLMLTILAGVATARTMAQAASTSAGAHRTNSEAATCRNAVRAHVSLNYPAGN